MRTIGLKSRTTQQGDLRSAQGGPLLMGPEEAHLHLAGGGRNFPGKSLDVEGGVGNKRGRKGGKAAVGGETAKRDVEL